MAKMTKNQLIDAIAVRLSELWAIPSHPRQTPPHAHYAPRDGISGGLGGQSRKGHAV
jgi:hypothetical protein